mmetsp:Transcript_5992/g.16916  ORF Transcript_5992/g.16916 Transcript_5992/m.16916 type:complete len:140 (+) Transcript_5992:143-562(+)|eukprot:CAMPEP_0119121342 /NCGR_PEP_ID=MMETSP1310-20130426/2022_1 /TAXON_ID=464262 /ORGANISM="Genus nov. species nov., Strain RCC2339" /LENGTH=139 /DNA_ID=CAMNT_0007110905 /DNA_START=144 /DNA_END=563 /DNA_ORIENTATION=-
MAGNYVFIIVGKNDRLLYSAEFSSNTKKDAIPLNMSHLVLHSSLDIIDEIVWRNSALYLKTIDRYGDYLVSAFVTLGHMRFLMLHDTKNEDGIKYFFQDVYECYVKMLQSPFYKYNTPIECQSFDSHVKNSAKRLKLHS